MINEKILEKVSNDGLIEILKNDISLYSIMPTEILESFKAKDIIILQILMNRIINK